MYTNEQVPGGTIEKKPQQMNEEENEQRIRISYSNKEIQMANKHKKKRYSHFQLNKC